MILITIDRVEVVDLKPWKQRKDGVPDSLFIGCEVFEERLRAYLKRWDLKRRLSKDDMMDEIWTSLSTCQHPPLRHTYVTSRSTRRYPAQRR